MIEFLSNLWLVEHFPELWRAVNVLGSLVALPAMHQLIKRNRGIISRRAMSLIQALFFAHVGIIIATVEALLYGDPLAFRTGVFSVVVGWTLLALYFPQAITREEEHKLT